MLSILLLTILELVAARVTYDRRKLTDRLQAESTRLKREIGGSHGREWVKVCPTEAEIVPIIPAIDDEGIKIFKDLLGYPLAREGVFAPVGCFLPTYCHG